jgi:hypothetical protein
MVIPELAPVAAVLGPVAWGIAGVAAVTMIGVALYETRDTWVPWVAGAFGGPGDSDTSVPPTTSGNAGIRAGYRVKSYTRADNVFTATYEFTSANSQGSGWYSQMAIIVKCKRLSDNKDYYATRGGWSSRSNTAPFTTTYTWGDAANPLCPTEAQGWKTVAWKIAGGTARGGGECYVPGFYTGHTTCTSTTGVKWDSTSAALWSPENMIAGGEWGSPGFDPRGSDVKYKTTVECIDSGGVKSSITADWTGDSPGMVMPSCAKAGKGHGTGKTTVDGFAPGTTQNPTRLWDNPAPQPTPGRELCAPTRSSQGCKLAVKIDGLECVMGKWECENWQDINNADPGKDGTNPRVSCQYGPYSVPLSTCNPLERAYEPDGAPVSEPNIDGNPATRSNTNLDSSPNPKPDAAKPLTVPGSAAAAPPSGSTTEQAQCFPSGWGMLNPVEWVMKPVGCALDAAFKPKKDVQTRITSMQGKFQNKVPISWFSVGGTQSAVSGGACPTNWALDISGQHVSLICGTPVEGIVLAFRPIMGAMLVMAALWPLIRSLFYAAIPIFKVTPS